MRAANRLIRDYCASDQRLHYIDIVPPMSDPRGNPRGDLYSWDGIHMNAQGYAIWTAAVRPVLIKAATLPRFNQVPRTAEL
jgi:lysophospholipase L1-like esterase